MRQKEIDHLKALNESINEKSIGSNPMFSFIELSEYLIKMCQK